MQFTPNTNVYLLTGVPLDNTYKDTLTFPTKEAQSAYFHGKLFSTYHYTDFSYQRMNSSIRVPANAENLWNVNYLMYQNTNFGNKWFYAFVTQVNYLNQNTTELVFEIDEYQTWMFDIQIKPSFVSREHTNNDTIGANTVPEGLELGPYIKMESTNTAYGTNVCILLAASATPQGDPIDGGLYCGIYSGLAYYAFDSSQSAAVNAMIEEYIAHGQGDAIVGISMVPKFLISSAGGKLPNSSIATTDVFRSPARPTTLDGYAPRNNKLYTYPYCFLALTTGTGSSAVYRYELLPNNIFTVSGDLSLSPNLNCRPSEYANSGLTQDEGVTIGGYPSCSWTSDAFANWFAGHTLTWSLGVIGSALPNMGQIASAANNPLSAVQTGLTNSASVFGKVAQLMEGSLIPPQAKGNTGAGSLLTAMRENDFFFASKTITAEYARIIDDYFSRFGYKTNRLKVPNVTGRASWNYVETVNADIIGNAPVGAIDTIKSMFNRGVTFWHGDYVGDYNRSNGVV